MTRRFLGAGIFLAVLTLCGAPALRAEARSYYYEAIFYDIDIHADTSVTVAEHQIYQFDGVYHQGWRSIPHHKIDAITDVSVVDGESRIPFSYSASRLPKEDPTSWGKYTTWEEDGATNIEWYFNDERLLEGTPVQHTFSLYYTVHGALSFYDTHDELYWNLFTDFEVPVQGVYTDVITPGVITEPQSRWYVENEPTHHTFIERTGENSFRFTGALFAPGEDATIALGWQKGLIDEQAYWHYFWAKNWPYLASIVLVLSSILFAIAHWYYTERYQTGKGAIIPHYEPPEHLPPAMAELIVRERLSAKAWSATVIDLAVRGYVGIEEKTSFSWSALVVALIGLASAGLFGSLFIETREFAVLIPLFVVCAALLVVTRGRIGTHLLLTERDYVLTRLKKNEETQLLPYESQFVDALFSGDAVVSTKKLRSSPSAGRALYYAIQSVEKTLDANTEERTRAYERTLTHEKQGGLVIVAAFFLLLPFLLFTEIWAEHDAARAFVILFGSTVFAASVVSFRMFYDAKLNKKGEILREDWLGFKLYLETAEKYRMQNLTPDLFEKYLSYAMIFGVEKKWAKAFESFSLPPPSWYHGAYVGSAASARASSFSPSSFAGGFSASFTSAFASSGASGASGGGGGAGGGGGGGGGGAS